MDGRALAMLAPWLLTALAAGLLVASAWSIRWAWLHDHGPWRRVEYAIAVGLGATVTLVRIPLASRHLATWDSVLFALGMQRYDVLDARPHPPGYPVYVAMGKVAQTVLPDPNDALVAISLLSHAAAVAMLYVVVRRWGAPRAAVAAALTFGIAPVPLYNSLIATTYPFEAFFTLLAAWLALWYRDAPGPRRAALLGALFALGVGVRQSLLIFLSPLLAWAVLTAHAAWGRRVKDALVASGTAILVALTWLIPMAALSGGWRDLRAATSLQTEVLVLGFTVFEFGWQAWQDLWPRFVHYVRPELIVLLPVLAIVLAFAAACGRVPVPSRPRVAFFAAWTVPPLAFYLLVFNGWDRGPDGYILVLTPALYAATMLAADAALRTFAAGKALAVTALVLLAPAVPFADAWSDEADRVAEHDAWADAWAGIEGDPRFDARHAAILTTSSWPHVKWHFPEHTVYGVQHLIHPNGTTFWWTVESHDRRDNGSFYGAHLDGPTGESHALPPHVERIVVFDFEAAGEGGAQRLVGPDVEVREAFLASGWRVLYFDVALNSTLEEHLDPALEASA